MSSNWIKGKTKKKKRRRRNQTDWREFYTEFKKTQNGPLNPVCWVCLGVIPTGWHEKIWQLIFDQPLNFLFLCHRSSVSAGCFSFRWFFLLFSLCVKTHTHRWLLKPADYCHIFFFFFFKCKDDFCMVCVFLVELESTQQH